MRKDARYWEQVERNMRAHPDFADMPDNEFTQIISDMKYVEGNRAWMFWLQDVDRALQRNGLGPISWLIRGRRAFRDGMSVKDFVRQITTE